MKLILRLLLLLFCAASCVPAQNDMRYFITRSGDKLLEGKREYRFISVNIPNLHLVEDNFPFAATNEWRFPDEFEINDALQSVKLMGGRAVRTYVLSICRKEGPTPYPCYVKRPGEFNEEAFRALDLVLAVAHRVGVRVVIPFVDNWKWWGGAEQYAEYRNRPADAFWSDPEIIADFQKTINFVLNRRNTITGRLYRDDPAILAWETGNELNCPYAWTKRIAAYIKGLDTRHLVWDGYYIGSHEPHPEAFDDPNIDIVSSHHYPGPNVGGAAMAQSIARYRQQIAGRKVYIVGEFGFIPVDDMKQVLDAVIADGVTGAMLWSLRFRNRDGGFYWHTEGASGNAVKAYHAPGFTSGAGYKEGEVLALLRAKAYEISGLPMPAPVAPPAPKLLPIPSVAALAWQGAAGATSYDVERAERTKGPWQVVGANVDETQVQYRPLFADATAQPGRSYFYRVRAKNAAGVSSPSNVVGPVRVTEAVGVDELADFSFIASHNESVKLVTANPRPYKEDAHRLQGDAGGWVMYRTPQPLSAFRGWAFQEGPEPALSFSVSSDGTNFTPAAPVLTRYPAAVNPYGYKLPVQYELTGLSGGWRAVKIEFRAAAQLSRVEWHTNR